MDPNDTSGSAALIAELARKAAGASIATVGGVEYLVTTDREGGVKAVRVNPADAHGNMTDKPARIVQSVTVQTQDSLVSYARDYKEGGSRFFANMDRNRIVAVLDYHAGRTDALADLGTADAATVANVAADFGQHVATLDLPFSEEWKVWKKADGELMTTTDFARFIRENAPDIVTPDAATLIELAGDLRGLRNVKFTGEVNMNAENETFEYTDATDVHRKNGMAVPEGFVISIPVYFGGRKVELAATLRHKFDEGRLFLGVKLLRLEAVRQAIFRELVDDVSNRAGIPVVYGSRGGSD